MENIADIGFKEKINVFWFRRDLRIEDNTGFYHALSSGEKLLPLFIFDTNIIEDPIHCNDKRISFIADCLKKIQRELVKSESSLLVLTGKPINIFEQLTKKYTINNVYTNEDYEPYAIKRDNEIEAMLKTKGVGFKTFKDQVIFEKNEIIKSDGKPYTVFTPYSKLWKLKFNNNPIHACSSESLLANLVKFKTKDSTLNSIHHSETFYTEPEIPTEIIKNYHLTRNIPSVEGTSKLSHHLRFGTISIRKLVRMASELNETWLNELIWREFFMMILWHFPNVITNSFKQKYEAIEWRNHEKDFERWCKGDTGYPIVDAGMRELNETGWMHNRVRMITASFLVKHLLIDWRWGEAYFAEKLLDYELSSNNGNWQWAAGCGCDAAPYFRIFNPAEQTRKFDPQHEYIKKWVPEYASKNYAQAMVEHNFARERAISIYRKSLLR